MGQPKVEVASGEAFSTTDSSAETEESRGLGNGRECEAGHAHLLNGMAPATSQVSGNTKLVLFVLVVMLPNFLCSFCGEAVSILNWHGSPWVGGV